MKSFVSPTLAVSIVILFAFGACDTDRRGAKTEEESHGESAHFGYTGEIGPAHWLDLDPSFAVCGTGMQQSPINLTGATPVDLANIEFQYQASEIHLVNNGHTIQANYDAGSFMIVDGKRFDLLQFHFHSPSENVVDGSSFPIEMHLVHKSSDDALAVIAVFIKQGSANDYFSPVWEHLPVEEASFELEDSISANDLLPANQATYRFPGSLTTPPCTEGVNWFVMASPVEMSLGQIATFQAIYSGNNRPLQALNGRTLLLDTTP